MKKNNIKYLLELFCLVGIISFLIFIADKSLTQDDIKPAAEISKQYSIRPDSLENNKMLQKK